MNIRELLDSIGVECRDGSHHHVTRRFVGIDCPFCGMGSGKYHLGIHTEYLYCSCWKCGSHTLFEILAALTTRAKAAELTKAVTRTDLPPQTHVTGRLVPPTGVGPLGPSHTAYLAGRGIDAAQAALLWGAGGIGLAARLKWRVYIPITLHGRQVSWTTRSIGKTNTRRYWSAEPHEESVHHKHVLYGADFCRAACIVHEGPLDVWRTGPGAVATLGLGYTQQQVAAIAAFPLRVVCLDNSDAAQAVAERLCDDLAVFPGRTVRVRLETGEDPGSADEAELVELRGRFLES